MKTIHEENVLLAMSQRQELEEELASVQDELEVVKIDLATVEAEKVQCIRKIEVSHSAGPKLLLTVTIASPCLKQNRHFYVLHEMIKILTASGLLSIKLSLAQRLGK